MIEIGGITRVIITSLVITQLHNYFDILVWQMVMVITSVLFGRTGVIIRLY